MKDVGAGGKVHDGAPFYPSATRQIRAICYADSPTISGRVSRVVFGVSPNRVFRRGHWKIAGRNGSAFGP